MGQGAWPCSCRMVAPSAPAAEVSHGTRACPAEPVWVVNQTRRRNERRLSGRMRSSKVSKDAGPRSAREPQGIQPLPQREARADGTDYRRLTGEPDDLAQAV